MPLSRPESFSGCLIAQALISIDINVLCFCALMDSCYGTCSFILWSNLAYLADRPCSPPISVAGLNFLSYCCTLTQRSCGCVYSVQIASRGLALPHMVAADSRTSCTLSLKHWLLLHLTNHCVDTPSRPYKACHVTFKLASNLHSGCHRMTNLSV